MKELLDKAIYDKTMKELEQSNYNGGSNFNNNGEDTEEPEWFSDSFQSIREYKD
jgi:hypothetical protein